MNCRFRVTGKKKEKKIWSYVLEGELDVYCIPQMRRANKDNVFTEEGKTQPQQGETCTSIVTGSGLKRQVM